MSEQAKHFGITDRFNMCIEECSELIQAISKIKRIAANERVQGSDVKKAKQNLIEEIADVENLTQQIKELLCIEEKVEDAKQYKIDRTEQELNLYYVSKLLFQFIEGNAMNLLETWVYNITSVKRIEQEGCVLYKLKADTDCYGVKRKQVDMTLTEDEFFS